MKKKLFLFAFSILNIANAFGQKNEISMLNDRFSFIFPDSAKNQARQTDIMSADPNINRETRVFMDIGSKRVVFFAEDLLVRSIDNLESKLISESTEDFSFSVEKKDNLDSTICYKLTPQKFNKAAEAILINSLIVKNSDNTLSKLSVYLNPKAFEDKATFDNIVSQVFSSFKKGGRKLNLTARTESFKILATKTVFNIKLPENYIVTVDKKYDFEVYKIDQVNLYGDKGFAHLLIYFGFHPSLVSNELNMENSKTKDTEGEYMLQKLPWSNYKDKKRNLYLREQIFIDDDIQKDVQNHIAMISDNEKKIEELAIIIKNSLLKYDK